MLPAKALMGNRKFYRLILLKPIFASRVRYDRQCHSIMVIGNKGFQTPALVGVVQFLFYVKIGVSNDTAGASMM